MKLVHSGLRGHAENMFRLLGICDFVQTNVTVSAVEKLPFISPAQSSGFCSYSICNLLKR